MAPAEGAGGGKRRRKRTSSIRAAAEHAAGSANAPAGPRKTEAEAGGQEPLEPSPPPLGKKPRRRSRTSEATRRAAAEASQPGRPKEPQFPDYEVKSETWDPWEADAGPPGRPDPDFDAQRTLGEWLEGVIPADAQVHFANAGREFAQGVQVTVDHHTGKGRRGDDGGKPLGPTRIEID